MHVRSSGSMSKSGNFRICAKKELFKTIRREEPTTTPTIAIRGLLLPIESKRSATYVANPISRGLSSDSTATSPSISNRASPENTYCSFADTVGTAYVSDGHRQTSFMRPDHPSKIQKSVQWTRKERVQVVDCRNFSTSPLSPNVECLVSKLNGFASPTCVDSIYIYESNELEESSSSVEEHSEQGTAEGSPCLVY